MADSFRGWDSTGVAVVSANKRKQARVFKKDVNGIDFAQFKQYERLTEAMKTGPNLVIGHNRAATRGSVADENAHPFVADNIVLVHNGGIWNYKDLDSGITHDVDSAHVAHAIARHGHKKVLEQLDGPAVLAWYDGNDHTFHIARTKDRTIYWIKDQYDSWWFSSEFRLHQWIALERHGLQLKGVYKEPREFTHFWCPVDNANEFNTERFNEFVPTYKQRPASDGSKGFWKSEQDKQDVAAGKPDLGEASAVVVIPPKSELPLSGTSTAGGTALIPSTIAKGKEQQAYEQWTDRSKMRANERLTRHIDAKLGDAIMVRADEIEFIRADGRSNSRREGCGTLTGTYLPKGLEVRAFDIPKHVFTNLPPSRMIRMQLLNLMNEQIKAEGRHKPIILCRVWPWKMRELKQGPHGILIDPDHFAELTAKGCEWCQAKIDPDLAHLMMWSDGDPLCTNCSHGQRAMQDMEL